MSAFFGNEPHLHQTLCSLIERWRSHWCEGIEALRCRVRYDHDARIVIARQIHELLAKDFTVHPELVPHLRRFLFEEHFQHARRSLILESDMGAQRHSFSLAPTKRRDIDAAFVQAKNKAAQPIRSDGNAADAAPENLYEIASALLRSTSDFPLEGARETLPFPTLPEARQRERLFRFACHLGFGTLTSERIRIREAHKTPSARTFVTQAPHRFWISMSSPVQRSAYSQLLEVHAFGRAIGFAAIESSAFWHQHPAFASSARTFGHIAMLWANEARQLREHFALREQDAKQHGVRLNQRFVLNLRVAAGAVIGEYEAVKRELQTLGLDGPRFMQSTSWPARFRALLHALRWWHALREHFDEDWYRNPRSGPAIRAHLSGGGAHSTESFFSDFPLEVTVPLLSERIKL